MVNEACRHECVALDTEFVWERTYYPRLGIVQIGTDPEECHLVDAVALKTATALGTLLEERRVTKILHDAQQDLVILRRLTAGAQPCTIFDTQCAAGFAGLTATASLAALMKELLGIELSKTESRTDWLQRPLSPAQRDYARRDVQHLPALRQALLTRVRTYGHSEWLAQELQRYDDPALYRDSPPEESYRRVKGAGALPPRQAAVLRELAAWREQEARRRDRPRGHILRDDALLAISRALPRHMDQLRRIRQVSTRAASRHGGAVLSAVSRGRAVNTADCPPRCRRFADPKVLRARTDQLLDQLRRRCSEAGIDPVLVATRADMTRLADDGPDPDLHSHPVLRGWRREFVGTELLDRLP